jgi:hypothetical protein
MHALEDKDQPQLYGDAYVQQSRFADEHEDMRHGMQSQHGRKMNSICDTLHLSQIGRPKKFDQKDVQHVENHKTSETHQTYA